MGLLDAPVQVLETLGTKLRRLVENSKQNNPDNFKNLYPDAAWTSGEVVKLGAVRKNTTTNKLYVAANAGTCGATMPSHTSGLVLTDGAVLWGYTGQTATTTTDTACPTVTVGSSALLTPFPFRVPVLNSPIRLFGGYYDFFGTTGGTSYYYTRIFSNYTELKKSGCLKISLNINSDLFCLLFTDSMRWARIAIDGRWYNTEGIYYNATMPSVIKLDFTNSGGKKNRRIDIYFDRDRGAFGGVYCAYTDTVTEVNDEDISLVAVSDSLWDGSGFGPFVTGGTTAELLSRKLGISDVWQFVTGGTGYIATKTGTRYNFYDRLPEAVNNLNAAGTTNAIWLLMGSVNDNGQTAEDITTAALQCYEYIRTNRPKDYICVIGLWPLNNANVPTTEAAVQAAVTAFNDSKTVFIPVFGDDYLPWVTGAWNNAANPGSVNYTLYISGDNTHPSDVGTRYLAERISEAVQKLFYPIIK